MSTLTCRIELNKERGVTVKVLDQQGQVTQTLEMNGETIKLTCQGSSEEETSVITQKTDGIEMTCKEFKVTAETVSIKSSKDTTLESEEKFDIKSTKEMTLDSKDKLTAQATSDLALSGDNVKASAKSKGELAGMNVDIKATQGLKASGGQSELSGTQQIEIKGAPIVKVASSGTLNLEGQAVTLKGTVNNVQGTMVKLG